MNRKFNLAVLALILGAGYTMAALAQGKPKQLVKQRQAAMTLKAKYFGPLAGMAQGKVPYNAEVVARNAAYLSVLDKMPWDGFAANTKDIKSRALPAVFSDGDKFKEARKRSQGEITKLVTLSKGGDEAAIKTQISAVGKACGSCHDDFREKR